MLTKSICVGTAFKNLQSMCSAKSFCLKVSVATITLESASFWTGKTGETVRKSYGGSLGNPVGKPRVGKPGEFGWGKSDYFLWGNILFHPYKVCLGTEKT